MTVLVLDTGSACARNDKTLDGADVAGSAAAAAGTVEAEADGMLVPALVPEIEPLRPEQSLEP